jgi:hypothetical protein
LIDGDVAGGRAPRNAVLCTFGGDMSTSALRRLGFETLSRIVHLIERFEA